MPNHLFKLFICTAFITCPVIAQDNRIDHMRFDAPELAAYGKQAVGVFSLQLVHPGQLDILHVKPGETIPTYDRKMVLEIWYPANNTKPTNSNTQLPQYKTFLRDGKTEVILSGRAVRDASPDTQAGPYPLIIVSHGYPGNRFLLSHLTENLASKGYVVVAIDHTESTYEDMKGFASTLLNRSLDQLFVLNEMARLNQVEGGPLRNLVDVNRTGLIGYSMGGYGAINTIGGGLTAKSVEAPTVPNHALAIRQNGNPSYLASIDKRIKAAVAIAPWGWNVGLWDADGLAAIKTPVFFIAGSADDVSGYSPGVRNIFEASINAPRYLLTLENANHNAGASIPAPKEVALVPAATRGSIAEHYSDAVWDTTRMNNISQHFVTAFFGKYLKQEANMDKYLNLVETAKDGKWNLDANGVAQPGHSYWKGFPKRSAIGLKLEKKIPDLEAK